MGAQLAGGRCLHLWLHPHVPPALPQLQAQERGAPALVRGRLAAQAQAAAQAPNGARACHGAHSDVFSTVSLHPLHPIPPHPFPFRPSPPVPSHSRCTGAGWRTELFHKANTMCFPTIFFIRFHLILLRSLPLPRNRRQMTHRVFSQSKCIVFPFISFGHSPPPPPPPPGAAPQAPGDVQVPEHLPFHFLCPFTPPAPTSPPPGPPRQAADDAPPLLPLLAVQHQMPHSPHLSLPAGAR